MNIGVDVDGVLADFNTNFMKRVVEVTGRDLFGPDYIPTTWNYPESLGYTPEEVTATWNHIKQDGNFWSSLPAYPRTNDFLHKLSIKSVFHDIYFITSRPGFDAKQQTEQWLVQHRFGASPTVLISSLKGAAATALALDKYIDDNYENCVGVNSLSLNTKVYMMEQPWNAGYPKHQSMVYVTRAEEMLYS